MAWKPDMTLDELNTEMMALCAKVKDIEENGGLTKAEEKELTNEVRLVVETLEEKHGTITTVFGPEVPAETQKLYAELVESTFFY